MAPLRPARQLPGAWTGAGMPMQQTHPKAPRHPRTRVHLHPAPKSRRKLKRSEERSITVRPPCCAPSIVSMALLTLTVHSSVHILQTFGEPQALLASNTYCFVLSKTTRQILLTPSHQHMTCDLVSASAALVPMSSTHHCGSTGTTMHAVHQEKHRTPLP